MVNSKYFPKSGIASDVGGIISANSKKNTVNERRMEEHNDTCKNSIFIQIYVINMLLVFIILTFSPESLGR